MMAHPKCIRVRSSCVFQNCYFRPNANSTSVLAGTVERSRLLIHLALITVLLFVQVDIFSFAIFVFELLSGSRPFREYRNIIDIKKAIRRGVRPSLESCDLDTQIPRLEGLMR